MLADCYRALGRHAKVAELWEELRAASPSAALVAEGRIVAAGSLADQGRLEDAIRLLSAAKMPTKRPKEHHLRVTYALADLLRAGRRRAARPPALRPGGGRRPGARRRHAAPRSRSRSGGCTPSVVTPRPAPLPRPSTPAVTPPS